MKNGKFYIKLLLLILLVISKVNYYDLENKEDKLSFYESDEKFVVVEKNIINKSFISYLYKDDNNNYFSKIFDYSKDEEIDILSLIKKDKILEFNSKINELIYLKYPKFISDELINENTLKSILFRDNELVIYFSNYNITPSIEELIYLKVNYNEIKNYLNFEVLLDDTYENESGYNYTNSKKSVAITFDDSPNKGKTNKILNSLKDNHFHATFFVVGEKLEYNKDLLISIKNNGNEIGSHTYKHQNLKKQSDEEFIYDYDLVNGIIKDIFNEDIKYLRPPYGLYKERQLKLLNVSFIMWSLDTLDWRYRNSDYLVNYVINNIQDGDIILFHDTYDSTVLAIQKLLPILYSMGYQVMSVGELAKIKGINIETNKVYHKFN